MAVRTPDLPETEPPAKIEEKFVKKQFEEVLILAMPNTSEENYRAFTSALARVHEQLPFSIAVTRQPVECVTKKDFMDILEKMEYIAHMNEWSKDEK